MDVKYSVTELDPQKIKVVSSKVHVSVLCGCIKGKHVILSYGFDYKKISKKKKRSQLQWSTSRESRVMKHTLDVLGCIFLFHKETLSLV